VQTAKLRSLVNQEFCFSAAEEDEAEFAEQQWMHAPVFHLSDMEFRKGQGE
jgi:hypothetical protein